MASSRDDGRGPLRSELRGGRLTVSSVRPTDVPTRLAPGRAGGRDAPRLRSTTGSPRSATSAGPEGTRPARGRLALLLAAAVGAAASPGAADVTVTPVPASTRWPEAVEEGALSLACGRSLEELERFFVEERLPFRAELVRDTGSDRCHVVYRPTVPGFRASPDDDPIEEIVFDSDPLLYLATSRGNRGEPVGAMREVLGRIPRPLDVAVLIQRVHDEAAYERATGRAYGETPHRISLLDRGVERNFWWVQDYLKAGTSSGGETILLPRRIFEGRPENGEAFEPLLASLARQRRFVRSRLSWEGGDLQFTRDPRDPGRLVLYYGHFAKAYWGESLTPAEFEYVLRLEFGAERALDLGGLAPHVDYFVSFVPAATTALVSAPRAGDLDVARAAVDALRARVSDREPEVLVALRSSLDSPDPDADAVGRLVARARRQQGEWSFDADPDLPDRMRALVSRVCPRRTDCFSARDQVRLAEADPALFEQWVHAVQSARDEQAVITAYLDLVEGQMETVPEDARRLSVEKAAELEALGFRVIRVPAFRVDLRRERSWPGISYVNGLVVDRQIFLPRFGLGEVEEKVFRDVATQLPEGYSIVPVFAERVLIRNGGLHCLAGLIRSSSD